MVKDKTQLYKNRVLDVLKHHGKLPKSRISLLTKMNNYTVYFILKEMLTEGSINKIDGIIILYDLVVKND